MTGRTDSSPALNYGSRPLRWSEITACLVLLWCTCCVSIHPYLESDLFWQIRTGHDIVQSGNPPHADYYSWTVHGERWTVPEWLTFVLYWEVYSRLGGMAGLLALRVILNAAAVALLFLSVRKLSGLPSIAFMAGLGIISSCASYFQTRPYQITFLFLVVTAYIATHGRRRSRHLSGLLWLIPLCAIWANLHQGCMASAGLLILYSCADVATAVWMKIRLQDRRAKPALHRAKWFAATGLGCALATLLTPYGADAYRMAISTYQSPISHFIIEWRPLPLSPSMQLDTLAVIAVVVAVCAVLTFKRLDLGSLCVAAVLAEQCLAHQRNVPMFAYYCMVAFAPQMGAVVRLARRRLTLRVPEAPKLGSLVIVGVGVWNLIFWTSIGQAVFATCPAGPARMAVRLGNYAAGGNEYPRGACAYLERAGLPADLRLFNDLSIGGYEIWRIQNRPVFIDGRNDLYFNGVLRDYMAALDAKASQQFFRILAPYRLNCIVTSNAAVKRFCLADPDWRLVYVDHDPKQTQVFVKSNHRVNRRVATVIAAGP